MSLYSLCSKIANMAKKGSGEVLSAKDHQEIMRFAVQSYKSAKSTTLKSFNLTSQGGLIQGIVVPGSIGAGVEDRQPPTSGADFDGKVVLSALYEFSGHNLESIALVLWNEFVELMKDKIEVSRAYFPYTFDTQQSLYYYFAPTRYNHDGLSVICGRDSVVYQNLIHVGQGERFTVTPYFVD